MSAATSDSVVWKNTLVPSAEAPRYEEATAPLPPFGPVDCCSVRRTAASAAPGAASTDTAATAATTQMRDTKPPKLPNPLHALGWTDRGEFNRKS